MGFALVVIEEHTRRPVHLRYDNPLCPIDHECAVWCHQRHVAHKDVLLFNIFNRFRTGVFIYIKNDQAQRHLQGSCICHIALLALFHIIFWFFQLVFHELQNCGFVEIFNREDRLKNTFDAFAVKRLKGVTGFQEQII